MNGGSFQIMFGDFVRQRGTPSPLRTFVCLKSYIILVYIILYYIGIYWVSNKSGFKSKSDLIYKFPKIGKMQKLFLSTIVKDNKGLLLRNSFLDYLWRRMPWWRNLQKRKYISTPCRNTFLRFAEIHFYLLEIHTLQKYISGRCTALRESWITENISLLQF